MGRGGRRMLRLLRLIAKVKQRRRPLRRNRARNDQLSCSAILFVNACFCGSKSTRRSARASLSYLLIVSAIWRCNSSRCGNNCCDCLPTSRPSGARWRVLLPHTAREMLPSHNTRQARRGHRGCGGAAARRMRRAEWECAGLSEIRKISRHRAGAWNHAPPAPTHRYSNRSLVHHFERKHHAYARPSRDPRLHRRIDDPTATTTAKSG